MSKLLFEHAEQGTGRIVTAAPYLSDLQKCLAHGDACPAKMLDVPAEQWQKMLDEAGQRLTFCDPLASIEKTFSPDGAEEKRFKGLDDLDGVPEKALMVYDAVLATNEKDRDGDIVHPEGMELEQKMPLLWQHVWSSPIGVMVKNLERSKSRCVNRYAIADTPLGKDAATLVALGALRKSHGFLPKPGHFEPLGAEKGADPTGFRIKKLEVYESSLVSIPAGAKAVVLQHYEKEFDAICRAVSEKKLQTNIVKQWAGSLYENRTKVFSGASPEKSVETIEGKVLEKVAGQDINLNINVGGTKHLDIIESSAEPLKLAPQLGVKSLSAACGEKSLYWAMDHEMPGSFEAVQSDLRMQARKNHADEDGFTELVATYSDSVIYAHVQFGRREEKRKTYRQSWGMKDGKAKLTGEPAEVEIKPAVIDKALDASGEYQSKRWEAKQSLGDNEKSAAVAGSSEEDPILELFS